ncbi:hypothetical protein DPV78_007979 [Talaromyces pinophilus]|nr:hypothetical protein DPV78_007979 [Talaromyces pinophilus]
MNCDEGFNSVTPDVSTYNQISIIVCCDPTPICIDGGCSPDCSPSPGGRSTEWSIPTATVTTTTTTTTLFGTRTATSITTATEPTIITDIVTTTKPTTITEPTTTTATVVSITTTTQAICPLGGIPCGQQCKRTNGSTCDQNTQLRTRTDDSQCNPNHVCLAGECCPDSNVCPSTPTCRSNSRYHIDGDDSCITILCAGAQVYAFERTS